jgi:hypothetical protein
MKKLVSLLFFISLFSCSHDKEIRKEKCVINYCEKIDYKYNSIHDEIKRLTPSWVIKTDCGKSFSTEEPYKIGDTIEITVIKYI